MDEKALLNGEEIVLKNASIETILRLQSMKIPARVFALKSLIVVPGVGLEPTWISPHDFKSCA